MLTLQRYAFQNIPSILALTAMDAGDIRARTQRNPKDKSVRILCRGGRGEVLAVDAVADAEVEEDVTERVGHYLEVLVEDLR